MKFTFLFLAFVTMFIVTSTVMAVEIKKEKLAKLISAMIKHEYQKMRQVKGFNAPDSSKSAVLKVPGLKSLTVIAFTMTADY